MSRVEKAHHCHLVALPSWDEAVSLLLGFSRSQGGSLSFGSAVYIPGLKEERGRGKSNVFLLLRCLPFYYPGAKLQPMSFVPSLWLPYQITTDEAS